MPRTKKEVELKENEKKTTSTVKKAAAKKSALTAKKATVKSDDKVLENKNEKINKSVKSSSSKKTTTKKITTTAKKETKSKDTKKISKTTKAKATTKTTSTSKVRKVKKSIENSNKFVNVLEYYDLPYRYNETVVKILAQTPKILFVYWDISDEDRSRYSEKYGEYFFNDTYPILLVHNKTLNYTTEVEINDFANSWYISIPDSRSEYSVELARRFKEYAKRNPDMPHKEDINKVIPVAYSNNLIMPNDHVLLDEIKPQVKYKNVKTNEEFYKSVAHVLQDNKLANFYDLYQEIYQVDDLSNFFSLDNPSSGNPTSTFK